MLRLLLSAESLDGDGVVGRNKIFDQDSYLQYIKYTQDYPSRLICFPIKQDTTECTDNMMASLSNPFTKKKEKEKRLFTFHLYSYKIKKEKFLANLSWYHSIFPPIGYFYFPSCSL